MRRLKLALATVCAAAALIGSAGSAAADPVCDNFPGPRDGKAWWYHAVCR